MQTNSYRDRREDGRTGGDRKQTHSCPSSGWVEELSFPEGCRTGWCFLPRTLSYGLFVAWEEPVELQHKATDSWCKTWTYIISSSIIGTFSDQIWQLVTPPVGSAVFCTRLVQEAVSDAAVSQWVLLCFTFLEITPQIHTVYNIYSFIVVATLLIKGNGG